MTSSKPARSRGAQSRGTQGRGTQGRAAQGAAAQGPAADSRGTRSYDADVAILGSGLAGSILAAILARGGARVQLIDAGSHPRFAVGESTIPHTSMLLRILAERYDVPEIKSLASFAGVQSEVARTCGVKRNFGFLYHRNGRRQELTEANELPIPKITNTENHLFRQDVDAWLLGVAIRYGVRVAQRTRVTDVQVDDSGVRLTADSGQQWRARFVVDASGFRSPLAQAFGLREEPSRLRTHSRTVFTHMVDVTPYDELVRPKRGHGNVMPWSQGTLHHVFEGGWIWVIPFNNHARATNQLVSVGLSVDPRIHPKPDCPPGEEFNRFIAGFPDIARQFSQARPVREWVSTGRLQYSSTTTVGSRWCLTSHAAGFIDALFSRGMTNTLEIVNALGWRLLAALREDDFDPDRFAFIQRLEQGLLDFNDELVANAYTSFQDYQLWNAWFRIWSLNQRLANFEIFRAYGRFLRSRDQAELIDLERLAVNGAMPAYQPAQQLMADAAALVREVQDGLREPGDAASGVFNLLRNADFLPPALGVADPENRCVHVTGPKVAAMLRWARTEAPPEIGTPLYEGLTLFLRSRLTRQELRLGEELKHALAPLPGVGRPLRVTAPR
jgi:FADH2 O2-dependent halogenase